LILYGFQFLRNVLAQVPKGSAEMVAAAIRTIFAQPDTHHVHEQLDVIAGMLGRQFPKLERMLRDAAEDLLAFTSFPVSHWKKVWSTNPLERRNKEIKRRTDVVGVFPHPEALLRLAGAVLVEAHDQWQVSDRRYLSEGPWPCSPRRPRRWHQPSSCRHRLPDADPARR
jgi:putative transposase